MPPPAAAPAGDELPSELRKNPPAAAPPARLLAPELRFLLLLDWCASLRAPLVLLAPPPAAPALLAKGLRFVPGGPSCSPGSSAAAESGAAEAAVAAPDAAPAGDWAPDADSSNCCCCLLRRFLLPGLLLPLAVVAAAARATELAGCWPPTLADRDRSTRGKPLPQGLSGLLAIASRSIAAALLLLRLCMRLKGGDDGPMPVAAGGASEASTGSAA